MPRLYAAADAFVLPTRGEGWGLPVQEAMAMGFTCSNTTTHYFRLPTIATNYSGVTMLVDAQTAFPITVETLESGAEEGTRWALVSKSICSASINFVSHQFPTSES